VARTPMSLDTILDVLRTSSDRLVTLSEGLTPEHLLTEPEPGEWCARDVLAHILACQDTWGGCEVRLLQEDQPEIRGTNPMTRLAASDHGERSFASGFDAREARVGPCANIAPTSVSKCASKGRVATERSAQCVTAPRRSRWVSTSKAL
jgi:hypothetical protein